MEGLRYSVVERARSVWLCGRYMLVVGYFGGALADESGHALSTAAGVFSWMLKDMVRATLPSCASLRHADTLAVCGAARCVGAGPVSA